MKEPDAREARRPWGARKDKVTDPGVSDVGLPADNVPDETTADPVDESTGAGSPGEADVDYKDRWLRTEADFQNFRRRSQRDLEEAVRFNEERLLLEMISQLDDLERGLEAASEAGAPEPWVQGIRLVANRTLEFLSRQGVVPIEPLGEPFDPELHEALLEVDATETSTPGDVVQVVRKGYRRGARALRPARVVVARRAASGV
jgi:molecular chaperone GrpE